MIPLLFILGSIFCVIGFVGTASGASEDLAVFVLLGIAMFIMVIIVHAYQLNKSTDRSDNEKPQSDRTYNPPSPSSPKVHINYKSNYTPQNQQQQKENELQIPSPTQELLRQKYMRQFSAPPTTPKCILDDVLKNTKLILDKYWNRDAYNANFQSIVDEILILIKDYHIRFGETVLKLGSQHNQGLYNHAYAISFYYSFNLSSSFRFDPKYRVIGTLRDNMFNIRENCHSNTFPGNQGLIKYLHQLVLKPPKDSSLDSFRTVDSNDTEINESFLVKWYDRIYEGISPIVWKGDKHDKDLQTLMAFLILTEVEDEEIQRQALQCFENIWPFATQKDYDYYMSRIRLYSLITDKDDLRIEFDFTNELRNEEITSLFPAIIVFYDALYNPFLCAENYRIAPPFSMSHERKIEFNGAVANSLSALAFYISKLQEINNT